MGAKQRDPSQTKRDQRLGSLLHLNVYDTYNTTGTVLRDTKMKRLSYVKATKVHLK